MQNKLGKIKTSALQALEGIEDKDALEQWRVKYIGRSSSLMNLFKDFGSLSKEERPLFGRLANQVKNALESAHQTRADELKAKSLSSALEQDTLDVTLPGREKTRGRLHPTTQTLRQIESIFNLLGFQVYRSPEVETDEFNFQLLNFPLNHPARDMQDSYYIQSHQERGDNPILLRTHTSPGQMHAMREITSQNPSDPPALRLILPGMCYRYEQVSSRYETQFMQVEGLAVGKNITFSDLKGTLSEFSRRMFGQTVRTRFRASHFPFTEPSAEMDIECFLCGGAGCSVCKKTSWLEILGCGMVHPNVLSNGGYDPEIYTGFAFGMGVERIAMLKHQINDIRYFWANDTRFLEQF